MIAENGPQVVLYIHGFGSSGFGAKAGKFRAHYCGRETVFLAPSLSYVPDLAIQTLSEIIEGCGPERMRLVGSSLGGFYAAWLSRRYGVPAVLINPAVRMNALSERLVGLQNNYFDGSRFEWTAAHLEMLKQYAADVGGVEGILLLLKKGDEVLDYRDALDVFAGVPEERLSLEAGGNHAFEDIDLFFPRIDRFFGL